eukprot:1434309-Pyramimonas_sp.AAC.1
MLHVFDAGPFFVGSQPESGPQEIVAHESRPRVGCSAIWCPRAEHGLAACAERPDSADEDRETLGPGGGDVGAVA